MVKRNTERFENSGQNAHRVLKKEESDVGRLKKDEVGVGRLKKKDEAEDLGWVA